MTVPLPDVLPPKFALRARFCFVDGEAREDAWLSVADGRFRTITQESQSRAIADVPTFDLGNCALIPGLTNAHTHLEFSDLRQPLGQDGMPLPDWIRLVMQQRRNASESAATAHSAFVSGLHESLDAGVTSLCEIASQNWEIAAFRDSPICVTAFRELIATNPQLAHERIESAKDAPPWSGEATLPKPGWSPHAPYTTSLELIRATVSEAGESGWPVAMHLAESPEEIEFLATGAGPFRELLEELNVWNAEAFTAPVRPLEYLKILSGARHAYVIHGNFLDDEELQFLAAHRDTMTLVFCPRTHAFFQHQSSPLEHALELGVRIAIGTDSRASNPDLNLFHELQFLAQRIEVPWQRILEWGTQTPGLVPGAAANLAVISLPDESQSDPHEILFAAESQVVGTLIQGALAAKLA